MCEINIKLLEKRVENLLNDCQRRKEELYNKDGVDYIKYQEVCGEIEGIAKVCQIMGMEVIFRAIEKEYKIYGLSKEE